jgi:5-methylcytosine-specific restriction endonuclease McrA
VNREPIPKQPRVKDKKCIDKIRSIGYCEVCGSRYSLQVHHIKSRVSGGDDVADNLICLCYICHEKTHKANISRKELKRIVDRRRTERT